MNKSKFKYLTTNELLFMLIGCIVGTGILSLPNTAVSVAKQDGWIAVLLGSIYPLYIILMAGIIIKRYPDNNIMDLSKMFFGKFLGSFLNLLFMAQFLLFVTNVISAGQHVLRVYAVWFLTPFKISLVLTLLIIYGTSKGLKTIAKINILLVYIIFLLTLSTLVSFKYGSTLNIQPILGAGWVNIFKSSTQTLFSYANMELLLILYPFVKDKGAIIKTAILATGIITLIYTWTVFITIYYLGPDIVPKSLWPFFFVSEGIKIPVVTSFRFIYMALWTLVMFKTAATQYFASAVIMNNVFSKLKLKTICLIFAPIILFIPLVFVNELQRRDFITGIMPWVTLFNLSYVTVIAILSLFIKKKGYPTSNTEGINHVKKI